MDSIKLFWNGICVSMPYIRPDMDRTQTLRRAAAEALTDLRYGLVKEFAGQNEVKFDVWINGKECGTITISTSIRLSLEDDAAA